jgi:hypothetical protein
VEGVATATTFTFTFTFTFALVSVFVNVHIRSVYAFSIVVVLVRIVREVARGFAGSREGGGSFRRRGHGSRIPRGFEIDIVCQLEVCACGRAQDSEGSES